MQNFTDFYSGKCLLLTGTTGFVGKCLLEKILRDLPEVSAIFLLVRQKKGKELTERVQNEILLSPIFNRLREEKDDFDSFFWSKIVPVGGDIGLDGLGLSAEAHCDITSRLNIIINCDAFFLAVKI